METSRVPWAFHYMEVEGGAEFPSGVETTRQINGARGAGSGREEAGRGKESESERSIGQKEVVRIDTPTP